MLINEKTRSFQLFFPQSYLENKMVSYLRCLLMEQNKITVRIYDREREKMRLHTHSPGLKVWQRCRRSGALMRPSWQPAVSLLGNDRRHRDPQVRRLPGSRSVRRLPLAARSLSSFDEPPLPSPSLPLPSPPRGSDVTGGRRSGGAVRSPDSPF